MWRSALFPRNFWHALDVTLCTFPSQLLTRSWCYAVRFSLGLSDTPLMLRSALFLRNFWHALDMTPCTFPQELLTRSWCDALHFGTSDTLLMLRSALFPRNFWHALDKVYAKLLTIPKHLCRNSMHWSPLEKFKGIHWKNFPSKTQGKLWFQASPRNRYFDQTMVVQNLGTYPEYALLKRFNNDRQFQHGGLISIYIEVFSGFPIETRVHFLLYFSTELCCIFQHGSVFKPFQLGSSIAFFAHLCLLCYLWNFAQNYIHLAKISGPFAGHGPFQDSPFSGQPFPRHFPMLITFYILPWKISSLDPQVKS